MPIICGQFDKENHDAFIAVANSAVISGFGLEDEEHHYADNGSFVHIVDNIYVRAFRSAASILDTTARIADRFDEIAGTDYASNILFSLR